MYINHLKHSLPKTLQTGFLVDANQRPRYWVVVWCSLFTGQLAEGTLIRKLRGIERLYQHAETLIGIGGLDAAIGQANYEVLAEVLESWFITIRNQPVATESLELQWQNGLHFVQTILAWLPNNKSSDGDRRKMEERLHKLNHLYRQLHINKPIRVEQVRSLPAEVVENLYEILDPEYPLNPFSNIKMRWRVYISFILMLHQGVRRGELLLLPPDCIKSSFDKNMQANRYWMNITENEYCDEDNIDSRYSKPSIKTNNSIRQIPVSEKVAKLVNTYVENYRGRVEHTFLLSSNHKKPLSTESITKEFIKITGALSISSIKSLRDRTGKEVISPHDLRHTCAVIRLNQLLRDGDDMGYAMQKLRSFFGWSKESSMPHRYARAVYEDRLSAVWSNAFDERINLTRSLYKNNQS